jgi:hypothetical protein
MNRYKLTEEDFNRIVKKVIYEEDDFEDKRKERKEKRDAKKRVRELPTVTVYGKKMDPTQGVKLNVYKDMARFSLLRNIIAKNMKNHVNGVKFDWDDGKTQGEGMYYCGTNKVDTLGPTGYLSKKGREILSTFCETYASVDDVTVDTNDYV